MWIEDLDDGFLMAVSPGTTGRLLEIGIVDQADALARRFEDHVPDIDNTKSADSLMGVRQAFLSRADSERVLMDAVASARIDGQSWSAIGTMLGTSGEAARQRYGTPVARA